MTTVEFRSEMDVRVIRASASDDTVVQAAQVSILGENNPDTEAPRLINYLMKNRHGSPFEHNSFTFFVSAPIFVFREWHRHRIASINEMSGRYTKLRPIFYTPGEDRKFQNVGTSGAPEMVDGTDEQKRLMKAGDELICQLAWDEYEQRLRAGISNELARTVLPVSIYSEMYWTVNARSLMNFLSLRVDSTEATFRTRPQWEIQMAAELVEKLFRAWMPLTHEAFIKNGRMAP